MLRSLSFFHTNADIFNNNEMILEYSRKKFKESEKNFVFLFKKVKFNLEPFSWESKSFFDSGILCVGLWGAAWFQRSIIWQTDFPPRNSKTSNNPRPQRALWPQLWKNILGGNYFELTQKLNFMLWNQNMLQAQFSS